MHATLGNVLRVTTGQHHRKQFISYRKHNCSRISISYQKYHS